MPTPKRTSIPAHPTNFYVGRQKPVQFIVIHDGETDEGSTAAEGMASWFARDHGAGGRSSAHESADTDSICRSVADANTAFGAPGVNANGWHLEHAGRAGQTASQWDDAASRLILANGAQAASEASVRLAPLTVDKKPIPARWLTDDELRRAQSDARIKGFITHRQASRVLGGTHTDPGPNFPADRYMALVRSHLTITATPSEEDTMAAADVEQIIDRINATESETQRRLQELTDFTERAASQTHQRIAAVAKLVDPASITAAVAAGIAAAGVDVNVDQLAKAIVLELGKD
jgi:hypothetical protein